MALSEGDVDHSRLDVGVAHGLHDGEGIGSRHGHLRPEGVPDLLPGIETSATIPGLSLL